VFELRPLDAIVAEVEAEQESGPTPIALPELRRRALEAAVESTSAIAGSRSIFKRSRLVRDYVLARAGGACEGCASPAPFQRPDGTPYLEPHHIRRLSDGGPDDPRHVIALCPTCHRRVHAGADGSTYNIGLAKQMRTLEPL
jgi:5-methylcytosine-specific restriction protein A